MFHRLPRVLRACITATLPRPAPLVGMRSSQVGPLAQGPTSLVKGSRASGSADEVLVIALAALTYDKRCGGADGNGRSLENLMQAVEGFSHGYVEGNAWRTPLSWTGKDKWIVAYLKEICRVSANEVANTLSVAFGGYARHYRSLPPARTHAYAAAEAALARCLDCARAVWREFHPGCLSVPLPPKSPDSPPLTNPFKPPRSSSPGTTMLGQSPLTRAHCGGGGACSLARSRALVVAVTFCSVRLHRPSRTYARARVRHQRASRASSPFSVPPPRTHARAATALACSLARSRARARAVRLRCGRSHRPSRAFRAPRVTRALAYVITAHRARHRRFPSPRARPARAPCSGGGAHSRTLDCARAVWRW